MGAETKLEAVRLALASVFGAGHETRDHVELAAAVVGEVYGLRDNIVEIARANGELGLANMNLLDERTTLRAQLVAARAEVARLKAIIEARDEADGAPYHCGRCDGGCNDLYGSGPDAMCRRCHSAQRDADSVVRLTAEVERLTTKLKSAEEVVVQARQLGAYSWEDRLDDSRVSDDAKQDARELGIAVWHYDQLTARLAGCKS